jgi:hypothetical protein
VTLTQSQDDADYRRIERTDRRQLDDAARVARLTKTDAWAAKFNLPVAVDGTTVLKYRVRVTY